MSAAARLSLGGAGPTCVGGVWWDTRREHDHGSGSGGRPRPARGGLARALATAARWTEVYSQAAVRIARVGAVAAVALAILALAGNVFTRNALGYSLFGAEELARFAFLWAIWLGVSLASSAARSR